MKRNQSILESSISGFYFAVQPLYLCFQRDYPSSFNLYFEKGLQIISKNESRCPSPRKDQLVAFAVPTVLPHFRIQSDKNLDYEWSLYASQQEGDEHEEFLEGQKVNLKVAWQRFQEAKLNAWEGQLEFNAIKCKLTYLVVIAKTPHELQQIIQQHIELLNHPIPPPLTIEEKPSTKVIQVDTEENVETAGVKVETPKRESIVEGSLPISEMKESKILNEFPTPEKNEPETPKRANLTRDREHPLSLSELNIAEAVQEEVQNYEASTKQQKVETIAEVPEVVEEVHEELPMELLETKGEDIRMTNSQLLNDKGEVIVPPAKTSNKKLIILAIVLALALSAIGYFALRAEQREDPVAKIKEKKPAKAARAEKGAKEEKVAKEEKGKGGKQAKVRRREK